MGSERLQFHDMLSNRRTFGDGDDFYQFVSSTTASVAGQTWTSLATGSGAAVAQVSSNTSVTSGAQDGLISLTTGGTQNNSIFVYHNVPCFLFRDNRPLVVEAQLNWTEAGTNNNAAVYFGLSSTVTATGLISNSSSNVMTVGTTIWGVGFFKGCANATTQLPWQTVTSGGAATAQTITSTQFPGTTTGPVQNPGTGSWNRLRIEVNPVATGSAEVTYFLDSNANNPGNGLLQCRDNTSRNNLIKDTLSYTSPSLMYLVFGIKTNDTNSQVMYVDYVAWEQLR